jgi:hypothetical protein
MAGQQNVDDLINDASEALSYLSVSTKSDIKYRPMPDPLSVYVPLNSLTEETIDSIVSTVQQPPTKDWNHSRRTLLAFLLAINNRVSEIENHKDSNKKFDEQTIQHAAKVRQWLVEKDQSENIKELDWTDLRTRYKQMRNEPDDEMARNFGLENCEPYFELTIERVRIFFLNTLFANIFLGTSGYHSISRIYGSFSQSWLGSKRIENLLELTTT